MPLAWIGIPPMIWKLWACSQENIPAVQDETSFCPKTRQYAIFSTPDGSPKMLLRWIDVMPQSSSLVTMFSTEALSKTSSFMPLPLQMRS